MPILYEYDKSQELHQEFMKEIERLVRELLAENKLKVLSVTCRFKSKKSLQDKLDRSPEKYNSLADVYDICGIRVITYFTDDVDKVAKLIEQEFDIDKEKSGNKQDLLDPDRFGYLSLHYIAKLPSSRLKLTECKRFTNCVFEIQIRSILQHAWAEIEHDLGYKSKVSIPTDARRRFARLAGLLELADEEFITVRDQIETYRSTLLERIAKDPSSVLIDKVSLGEFVKGSRLIKKIESGFKYPTRSKPQFSERFIEFVILRLLTVGFKSIGDVDKALKKYKDIIPSLGAMIIKENQLTYIPVGLSLNYLCVLQAINNDSLEGLRRMYKIAGFKSFRKTADEVFAIYKKVSKKG
jgi:putative GTP pyrophosphokinase